VTEVTAAPASQADTEQTGAAISAFRRHLEGHVSVSATVVQDCLIDLWASLPDGDTRTSVERWLTETLERNLYSVTDVDDRLANFLPQYN
jgi:DNA-directed RNA polymerase specialized sigma24 family protein